MSDAITGVDHTVGYVRRSVEFLAALSDAELTVFEEAARATKASGAVRLARYDASSLMTNRGGCPTRLVRCWRT